MAVRAYTILHPTATDPKKFRDDIHVIEWTGLLNTDTGTPLEMGGSADRSIQVSGTFGVGGNCKITGRNGKTGNFVVLTDPQGNALDFTAEKIEAVSELTQEIRPEITAGDGATTLTVRMLLRRPFK